MNGPTSSASEYGEPESFLKSGSAACQAPAPPKLKFSAPTYVDKHRAGGEPVTQVAEDGSIILSAHAGTTHVYKDPTALPGIQDFATEYANQTLNWRSTDAGLTWDYVGTAGQPHGR